MRRRLFTKLFRPRDSAALFGPVELVALAAFLATVAVWTATIAVLLRH